MQVVLPAVFSAKEVSERTGVSHGTVRRVGAEDEVEATDDRVARRKCKIGRRSKTAPFVANVESWLEQQLGLPTVELLRRAKLEGYRFSKTAFYVRLSRRQEQPRVHRLSACRDCPGSSRSTTSEM